MHRSRGLTSWTRACLMPPAACAAASAAANELMMSMVPVNSTECPRRQAAWPGALIRWLLPRPAPEMNTTLAFLARKFTSNSLQDEQPVDFGRPVPVELVERRTLTDYLVWSKLACVAPNVCGPSNRRTQVLAASSCCLALGACMHLATRVSTAGFCAATLPKAAAGMN